jgi:hypothetical protein
VVPHLSGGWRHNNSTKTRQAGHANEHSIYYLISMSMNQRNFCIIWFNYSFTSSMNLEIHCGYQNCFSAQFKFENENCNITAIQP